MTSTQKFLLTISNRLDAQETLIEAQRRQIADMTAMSKTHYAVPKAVSRYEVDMWWEKNSERFVAHDHRGYRVEYNTERALDLFRRCFAAHREIPLQTTLGDAKPMPRYRKPEDDIDGVPV